MSTSKRETCCVLEDHGKCSLKGALYNGSEWLQKVVVFLGKSGDREVFVEGKQCCSDVLPLLSLNRDWGLLLCPQEPEH